MFVLFPILFFVFFELKMCIRDRAKAMFSKPIFKQCVRSNGKLWAIFTAVACAMLYFMMSSFDAGAFSSIASATEGTRFENLASNFGSFLGLMETFYRMLPILLGMVYAILATSNLIVSEVDLSLIHI